MVRVLFLQLEELFSRVTAGEFDDAPYGLAVELETLANTAWDEVDELLFETYETDFQPTLTIE